MPDIVNSPTVIINLPDGPCDCPNPLYEYVFHPLPSDPDFPDGSRVSSLHFLHESITLIRFDRASIVDLLLPPGFFVKNQIQARVRLMNAAKPI